MPLKKKCLIVDDDDLSREIIKELINKTEILTFVKECESAIEAADYLRNNPVDILFLDVEMPLMSGIDLLKSVKTIPNVILITAKENYAVEAFEYAVSDYIVKPVSYARFLKAVNKVVADSVHVDSDPKSKFFIKTDGKIVSVTYNEIQFFEAMGDYVVISTEAQKLTIHSTLSSLVSKIRVPGFIRVHRSFVINIEKINSIEDSTVIIAGRIIPIGNNYKQELFDSLGL